MWRIIGSAGTVNVGDIGKVNFAGSVVQIGTGSPGVVFGSSTAVGGSVAEAASATAILHPKTQATIRYGVTPFSRSSDSGIGNDLGSWELTLTFRDGAGQVAATLIEVRISGVGVGNVTPVQETRLIHFDSQEFPAPSTHFRTFSKRPSDALTFHRLDFRNNAYYVERRVDSARVVPDWAWAGRFHGVSRRNRLIEVGRRPPAPRMAVAVPSPSTATSSVVISHFAINRRFMDPSVLRRGQALEAYKPRAVFT